MQFVTVEGIPTVDSALKLIQKFGDQLPFAISKALNDTASDVQDFEVMNLKDKFKIRRNWFAPGSKYGVKVKASSKTNLQAEVYTRAPWLMRHEYGGTKTAGRYPEITIPVEDIRQDTNKLIPTKLRPSKVLANMKKFHAFMIGPNIWQRFGKGKDDIRVLFFGKQETNIPGDLGFRTQGVDEVQKVYDKNFGAALAFAIATAKSDNT